MAKSSLRFIGQQVYFLSEYFLRKDQQLVHGAEIYAGYYNNDQSFVDQIENQGESKQLFTFQETERAIEQIFNSFGSVIFPNFVKMLLFDAWVGNNDRHFYNWGVIRHVSNKEDPYFSPIYDSARGLYWNTSEKAINDFFSDPSQLQQKVEKYAEKSSPKIGCSKTKVYNHFDLITSIYNTGTSEIKEIIYNFVNEINLNACFQLIDDDFSTLLSSKRIGLIKMLLENRHLKLLKIVKTKE